MGDCSVREGGHSGLSVEAPVLRGPGEVREPCRSRGRTLQVKTAVNVKVLTWGHAGVLQGTEGQPLELERSEQEVDWTGK